ncbi:hypothetical protein FGO68_gene9636 [Halteria grandinella]|uniref:V-type proton ATPase subunit G n=1 Tax=Halteria grandinella TaxID=5974 RepID=A0A8J8NDX0_HALGN|nr:hypothetical protein FGO68_gene9636 [Halteria grandinella]
MQRELEELLKAENEVNKKVQEALEKKNKLLRSIKEKSEQDIAEFKAAKEAEYQRDYAALKSKIENEKGGEASKEQVDMKVIEEDYARNRDSVVELLVRNVLSVNIEIPKVVKGAF